MKRNFLSITDLSQSEIMQILSLAKKMKQEIIPKYTQRSYLSEKSLIMLFEKPSLRTRLSFEIGMQQLGGYAIYLGPKDIGLGTRESVSDVTKVASSMGDILMARTFLHSVVEKIAQTSCLPVINGLSNIEHPCQILADLLTIWERKGTLSEVNLAFIGDGDNNVAHSLVLAAAVFGMRFTCASPKNYCLNPLIVSQARHIASRTKAEIHETSNPFEAVKRADVIYTDTWTSMGEEAEKEKRSKVFSSYKVTSSLMKRASNNAIFMHDLPAYRGYEVTSSVIDGPQSVIFQQAENRLHAQKALLVFLAQGI